MVADDDGCEVERGRSARITCLGSDAKNEIENEFFFDLFNCLFMCTRCGYEGK